MAAVSIPTHADRLKERDAYIRQLALAGTRPARILELLSENFPELAVERRQLYNILARLRKRGAK